MAQEEVKFVVSDLHLGRGLYRDGVPNPSEDFKNDTAFAEFLRYMILEHRGAELVLNGDIFDVIKSVGLPSITKKDVMEFVDDTITGHWKFFKALSDFMWEGGKVVHIIGNHDQAFACPDVQRFFLERIRPPEGGFRFALREYFSDGVWIEHGNRYETLNRVDVSNVWVDGKLNMPWSSKFTVELINPLKAQKSYIDKVRPIKNLIRWGLIFDTGFTFKAILKLIFYWLRNRRYKDPVRKRVFGVSWKMVMESMGHSSCDKAASALLARSDVNVVVFGHTHRATIRRDGGKIYTNCGTWTEFAFLELPNLGLQTKLTFVFLERFFSGWFVSLRSWRGTSRVEEEVF